jgi:hypothetical protein
LNIFRNAVRFATLQNQASTTSRCRDAVLSVLDQKAPPTGAVVVLSNPRLNGNNLAYDVRALKGSLPATGIDGTLFIDGSGGYCDPVYARG